MSQLITDLLDSFCRHDLASWKQAIFLLVCVIGTDPELREGYISKDKVTKPIVIRNFIFP